MIRLFPAFDLEKMVEGARKQKLYHASAIFAELLVLQAKKEAKIRIPNYEYFGIYKSRPEKAERILASAKQTHDIYLMKHGQASIVHQCNYKPFNTKLKIKKNIIYKDLPDRESLRDMYTINYKTGRHPEMDATHYIALNSYSEKL